MTHTPNYELRPTDPDELVGPAIPAAPPSLVRVHLAGVTLHIEWQRGEPAYRGPAALPGTAPAALPAGTNGTPPDSGPAEPDPDLHYIRSPMVGTFYHAPEPGSAPFVAVGDAVYEGQQVGIVEAMKLMNGIDADLAGRVAEVLVANGGSVEYDQPLLAIEPE